MPSPTTTLSPGQLVQDLGVRDLTDPDVRFHLQLATRAVATFGALGARNDTSGADVS